MSSTSYSKMDEHGRPVKPVSKEEQKTARISKKIDGVKNTMHSNIAKATARGAQLKDLEDQTEQLEASGSSFLKTSGDVKKMFQWKAFLWQLAFAGIILVILSAVTLYILSATGVLNNQGRSAPAAVAVVPLVVTSPPTDAPVSTPPVDPTTALFTLESGVKAFQEPDNGIGAGDGCIVGGISTVVKACAAGLTCTVAAGATKGFCRPTTTPVPPEKSASESQPAEGACPKGEVACTAALVAEGNACIIGRCIIQGVAASEPSAVVSQSKGPGPEFQASSPLTGAGRVFQPNGEDPTKTESEIVEALVTLHRHGADCAVGILHKDCTLELLMQAFGVSA